VSRGIEIEHKTTQKIDKITMNSSENDKSDCKFHKIPTRNKVRKQTLKFFIDRLARGLVAAQLASPQPVQ
jgi:hypothetical protein